MPISTVECCDCMDFMAKFPDKFFDLAIVDPPYGMDFGKTQTGKGWIVRKSKDWDKTTPTKEYFIELSRVSKNQIIWGGNYMAEHLPPSRGWVFWDKGQRKFSLADGELAWTSFDRALRVFDFPRPRANQEDKIHPTQKPVALYVWLLQNYAKPGDKILDTHMGSQSSRIAAWKMGFDYWGCEIDQEYFDQGCARFEKERRQLNLFTHPEKPKQEALF